MKKNIEATLTAHDIAGSMSVGVMRFANGIMYRIEEGVCYIY